MPLAWAVENDEVSLGKSVSVSQICGHRGVTALVELEMRVPGRQSPSSPEPSATRHPHFIKALICSKQSSDEPGWYPA